MFKINSAVRLAASNPDEAGKALGHLEKALGSHSRTNEFPDGTVQSVKWDDFKSVVMNASLILNKQTKLLTFSITLAKDAKKAFAQDIQVSGKTASDLISKVKTQAQKIAKTHPTLTDESKKVLEALAKI
jgi:hypothetical protein